MPRASRNLPCLTSVIWRQPWRDCCGEQRSQIVPRSSQRVAQRPLCTCLLHHSEVSRQVCLEAHCLTGESACCRFWRLYTHAQTAMRMGEAVVEPPEVLPEFQTWLRLQQRKGALRHRAAAHYRVSSCACGKRFLTKQALSQHMQNRGSGQTQDCVPCCVCSIPMSIAGSCRTRFEAGAGCARRQG